MMVGLKPSSASFTFNCLYVPVTAKASCPRKINRYCFPGHFYVRDFVYLEEQQLPVCVWNAALRSWAGSFWHADIRQHHQSPCFLSASVLPYRFSPHVLNSHRQRIKNNYLRTRVFSKHVCMKKKYLICRILMINNYAKVFNEPLKIQDSVLESA